MKGVERFMARRPLTLAAFCYAAGAAIGCAAQVPALFWGAGLALSAALFAFKKDTVWLFCALALAGAWACAALGGVVPDLPQAGTLSGRVCDFPKVEAERTVMTLDRAEADGAALDTRVRLYYYGEEPIAPGDRVYCEAQLWRPKGRTNPGGFDFAAWLGRQGVGLCATASQLRASAGQPGLAGLTGRWRERLGARLDRLFGEQGPLARAMMLGDKNDLPEDVYDRYRAAGVAHLLAVSGLHVSCLASAVCFALGLLGVGRSVAYWATLVLAIAYALLVGAPSSAVRAVCMFAVVGGARQSGRPYDALTGLSGAALLLLAGQPLRIGETGFILSFSAVLGMLLLGPPIVRALRVRRWPRRIRWAGDGLAVSLGAQLGTLPAVCCLFGQINPYAPITNLPAVPLCTLALPLMAPALLADMLCPVLAPALAAAPRLLLWALDGLTSLTSRLPGATLYAPAWPWPLLVAYAACALAVSDYLAMGKWVRRGALAALPLCLALAVTVAWMRVPDGLSVTFLDAGQADAMVVSAQKRTYLVDVGEAGGPMADYLKYTGRGVDGVFLSHGHADHGGGLADILKERRVPVVYLPEGFESSDPDAQVAQTLRQARERGVRIEYLSQGDQVALSPQVTARVLAPEGGGGQGNAASLVLCLAYGQGAVLLPGDLPASAESACLTPASVVKAAHHGGADATSEFLLRAANPAACVISVGRNSYGHPSEQLLERLKRLGIAVYRTDRSGAVTARILPDGAVEMETFL